MPMDPAMLAAAMGNVKPETFMGHWKDIMDAKEASHEASMAVTRAKKAAKRDGIDLDVLALVEKLSNFQDPDELNAHLRKLIVYSEWAKMPLGAFADGLTTPIPQPSQARSEEFELWQAEQEGITAGRAGRPQDTNKYDAGSARFAGWDKGWRRGFKTSQKKIAGQMAKNAAVEQATGRRGKGNGRAAHAN